jgi:pyruvate/2-oxoglutarate dehydrogenase complex dihydrolipoamide dehydrogenase (E3) component
MTHVDVLVLGSGQAGGPLSWRLARAGRSVVLVERAELGGTCVNEGCTPTKTFLASAHAAHAARHASLLGVDTGLVEVDMARVVARKEAMVEEWRDGVARNVEKAGERLRLVRGHARFVGPRTVAAAGETIEAETVVVNVGARARVPDIPGLDRVPFLNNRTVMELEELPDHLVVLGGGFVGCELGQAFHRFGAQVTLLQAGDQLLRGEDEEVAGALQEALESEGMDVRLGSRAVEVGPGGEGVVVVTEGGGPVTGSQLLVAVGRVPNTDELGVEAAGIELDEGGWIRVDEEYRTSADGVYAVGDCTGGPQFTHASWDDHRILFDLLTGGTARRRDDRLVPFSTFTDPQVARVGLTEREARERGVEVEVATLDFGRIARARETGRARGLVKVLVDPDSERILGAAVVGAEAAELVTVLQVLMEARAPASVLVQAQMIHPAFVEGLQSAVMTLDRYALS